jgi:hypothetical protein
LGRKKPPMSCSGAKDTMTPDNRLLRSGGDQVPGSGR